MAWSPDVIAGVTIALVLALIGWGGTVYCWIHKKKVTQGEISTVDKWLSKGSGIAASGVASGYAGFVNTTPGQQIEMERMADRHRDLERGEWTVDGVDNMGEPRAPPPVYNAGTEGRRAERPSGEGLEGDTRRNSEVPGYQERA